MTEATSGTTSYGYDLRGNIAVKTLPNGDVERATYDALNRTESQTATAGSTQALYQYIYEHDLAGNVTKVGETYPSGLNSRTVENSYDRNNRLMVEAVTSGTAVVTTSYGYDSRNNRTSKVLTGGMGAGTTTYTYNDLNQLTDYSDSAQSVALSYDAAGNRVARTITGGTNAGTDTYTYDGENRLVRLEASHEAAKTYSYTYDYRTRRVVRDESQAGGVVTKVVFSGGTSVMELEGESTTPAVEYIRGSDYGGGVGGILYTIRGSNPSYTHENRRGDVIAKTNTNGVLTYQASYEAFGTRTQEQGSTQDRQKANTKDEDPTGLLNEGFRYRDLETGVFITRDPAGFVDGPNLYTYVRQNPWTKFDPEGLFEIYAENDGLGHVGFSTSYTGRRVNYDVGRYAGKYKDAWYQGPNVIKRTTGQPDSSKYKEKYGSFKFTASPEIEKRLSDAFQKQFNDAKKSFPKDVKDKLANPSQGDLPSTSRYTGTDWGLLGPNCKTSTFSTARTVFEETQKDKSASDKLKAEAKSLNELVSKAEATQPSGVKANLEKMASEHKVEKTSPAEKKEAPKPAEKKKD